ncbi:hypothetical protein EW026_g3200 [Hermanssonia centrifuga]|uniref:RRM domain-containing protein n=1 Tax=Hermanssonia centrifuga TaxID=98765 RepID=A0A4S4KM21_9APHY|nr:hypothetical protein EW026_g3200 [Hermanssonia centrifuga]
MPFTLRVFDPLKLYCARLGSSFGESDFAEMFSKFGKVKKAHLMKVSSPTTYGFISFESQDEAAIAIKATKGTSQGGHEIIVRYYEPTAQFLSHPPGFGAKRSFFPCIASPNISGPATCNAPGVDAGNNGNDTTKQEEPQQQDKEKEEKDARLKKAQQKREVADAAEQVAQKEREMAEKEEADKANQFALALEALEDAEKSSDFAELRLNCAEADLAEQKRLLKKAVLTLQEARDKREWAKNRVNDTFIAKEVALGEQQQAKRRREEAEHEVMRWRDEKVRAETEERQVQADILGVEEDEEARRKEELAESIRKMQELRKLEEEDKARKQCETEMAEFRRRMAELEAAEKEAARLAKEESKRKAREEEQKARELREREAAQEAARKAELDRKEAYYQAAAKETTRCKLRDESRWVQHIPWNLHFGLARFKLASAEFDDIRFNETQPLTFESVPWPTLLSPYKVTLEDIDWQIVEAFFVKVSSGQMEGEGFIEYGAR